MRYTYGKASRRFLNDVVLTSLGARRRQVLEGPGLGLDNAVLSVARGRVLIVTSDPVSVVPSLGMETSAWMSVHLIASDFTTSGTAPEFAAFTYNFPRSLDEADRESYLRAVSRECRKLGVAIVSGHTGSYPGSAFTIIGGGTMFGFARRGEYVTPRMAREGDMILMTKGAAIEASAYLACSFPRHLEERIGKRLAASARRMTRLCSTVTDATIARTVGLGDGLITSMHDATEGGVIGGLEEMALASGTAFVIEPGKIMVTKETMAVCQAFGLDPLSSLSEGTLLITCSSDVLGELQAKLRKAGIQTTALGQVRKGSGLMFMDSKGGLTKARIGTDGYWHAYDRSVGLGLK